MKQEVFIEVLKYLRECYNQTGTKLGVLNLTHYVVGVAIDENLFNDTFFVEKCWEYVQNKSEVLGL